MAQPATEEYLSVQEYLERERDGSTRHEYAGGRLFAMSGASDEHNRITLNVASRFLTVLRGSACRAYASDMKVRTGDVFYYPDVLVTCDPDDTERYFKRRPCLIVEVLSPTTEAVDRGEKLYNYRHIPTLEVYVLAHQDRRRVEVYRRAPGVAWTYEVLEDDAAVLELPCVNARLALADVYDGVL